MIITVIHGAMHKGITYSMTKAVLDKLGNDNEIHEFFMPADAPGYCVGCYSCFMKNILLIIITRKLNGKI